MSSSGATPARSRSVRPRRDRRPSKVPWTPAGYVRIGPVATLPQVLAELGAAPRRVLARARVRTAAFRDPESRISLNDLGRVFAAAEAMTGCDHVGLLVGERFTLGDFGPLGDLMRNAPSVEEALRALLLNLYLHDRGGAPVLLDEEPASVVLGYSIHHHGAPAAPQLYAAAIAIGFRLLQELCGPAWKPLTVQFAHRRPADLQPYRRIFGTRLHFDAEISGIVFASSWLGRSIPGADAVAYERLRDAMARAVAAGGATFSEQVQGVLHQMVMSGTASAPEVARLFGIHERTLRKRLRAERTTLHRLVGRTQFEIARQLLANTRLPASEIAAALHYADLSTFSRAFKTWAGVSPRRYREAS